MYIYVFYFLFIFYIYNFTFKKRLLNQGNKILRALSIRFSVFFIKVKKKKHIYIHLHQGNKILRARLTSKIMPHEMCQISIFFTTCYSTLILVEGHVVNNLFFFYSLLSAFLHHHSLPLSNCSLSSPLKPFSLFPSHTVFSQSNVMAIASLLRPKFLESKPLCLA